jgi:hypothetical protein
MKRTLLGVTCLCLLLIVGACALAIYSWCFVRNQFPALCLISGVAMLIVFAVFGPDDDVTLGLVLLTCIWIVLSVPVSISLNFFIPGYLTSTEEGQYILKNTEGEKIIITGVWINPVTDTLEYRKR